MNRLIKRSVILISLVFFAFALAGWGYCKTAAKSDSLTYYGYAFVKLKTSEGKIIYIDPYGVSAKTDSADIVLVTHEHSDHNDLMRILHKAASIRVSRSGTSTSRRFLHTTPTTRRANAWAMW